jgi:hypothetical protein
MSVFIRVYPWLKNFPHTKEAVNVISISAGP